MIHEADATRSHLRELLTGGFAPVVTLLREFHYDKAAVMLDGLPFSAWSLLEHMRSRQGVLLHFIKSPESDAAVWPEAYWPKNTAPESELAWNAAISSFEADLSEIIQIIEDPESPLFQQQKNGKTLLWAAIATLQHNAYHIGQIKAIGRHLGVW